MGKGCETFEHTADVGLSAWGDTRGELYEALAEGLADLVCPRRQVRPRHDRALRVDSEDAELLAVDFLAKLLAFMQTERIVVCEVQVHDVDDTHLAATVRGEPIDIDRHRMGDEIKAVTYHMLEVKQQDGRWTAKVILDT